MKKILSFSMILFLTFSGILIISSSINSYFNQVLYYQQKEVSLQLRDNANYSSLVNQLQKAATGTTSVSQYFFTGQNDLIIYSANTNLPIKRGTASSSDVTNYKKTGSALLLPNSQYKVKLYPFNKIKNLGLNNVFYVRGNVAKITRIMRHFGIVKIKSEVNETAPENNNIINFITLALLTGIVSLISLMFVIIKERQAVILRKFFGYRLINNVYQSFRSIAVAIVIAIIISVILLIVYAAYNNMLIYYKTFVSSLSVFYASYLFLIILIYSVAKSIQAKSQITSFNWARGSLMVTAASAIGFIVCILLVSIKIPEIHQDFLYYQKQIKSLNSWISTKNIYQTNVTNQLDRSEDRTEVTYDISAKDLWQRLKKQHKTFVVFSDNLLGTYAVARRGSTKRLVPWYKINSDNKSVQDYIILPSGRAITADINYLKLSKTKLVSGAKIAELQPTLFTKILIVPEKYKKFESRIRSNYLSEFLFQLNTDFKDWRHREHTPKFTRKNLKIKIVYAKNGQNYFTYNPNSGDNLSSNMVRDPIIRLFDNYQNSLSYGNLFTLNGGFFFFNKHVGQAYDQIKPQLIESRMGSTINYVTSIYTQKAQLVQQTQKDVSMTLTQLILFSVISFVLLSVLISQYYMLREREIIVKRLMGYPIYKIIFNFIIFIVSIFVISSIISVYLAHAIDWLSLVISGLLCVGAIALSFIIIIYDIHNRNRTIGSDS